MENKSAENNGVRTDILPDIDQQIDYVKRIRKSIAQPVRPLQNDTQMICAIEQSLIAAKWLAKIHEKIKQNVICEVTAAVFIIKYHGINLIAYFH